MARKKKAPAQAAAQTTEKDIFAHFKLDNPLTGGQDPEPVAGGDAITVDQATLLAKMSAMEARMAELQASNQRLSAAPAQATGHPGANVDPGKIKLDLTGMPDPYDKPAEYQAMLAERVNAVIEARTHAVESSVTGRLTEQQQRDGLWKGFEQQHEQWAGYPDLVGAVAEKLARQAQQNGLDPKKYMFQNTPQFYSDIVKELDANYGALLEADEEAPEAQEQATGLSGHPLEGHTFGEETSGRTVVQGGLESAGKPAGKQAGNPPSDMFKDLQDIQRSMGLI